MNGLSMELRKKLLFFYALIIGIAVNAAFESSWLSGRYSLHILWAAFFFACWVAMLFLNGNRLRTSRAARLYAVFAVALQLLFCLHPNRALDGFMLTNLLAIPLITMLAAVLLVVPYQVKREGAVAGAFLYGYCLAPFQGVPRYFAELGSLCKGLFKGKNRPLLIGLAITVPLVVVVLMLLSSADLVLGARFSAFFEKLRLLDLGWQVFVILAVSLIIYGTVASLSRKLQEERSYQEGTLSPTIAAVPLIALIAIYLLFGAMQFLYLFGGQLPVEYSYAEYARRGFFELIAVASINFALLGLTLRYIRGGRITRLLLTVLMGCTALLLVSAFLRLSLYIGAYGLTFKRLLAFWFLIYLSALTLLSLVRLYREKLPLLSIASTGLIVWYLLLNLVDWTNRLLG